MNRVVIGGEHRDPILAHLMREDFCTGFLLIDTEGTLAPAITSTIPQSLTKQTVYFDAGDREHPAGFNVLDSVPEDDQPQLAEDLCAVFDVLFPEGQNTLSRANASFVLLNCLRVLLKNNGSTLLDVLKLLDDTRYSTECIRRCTDPVIKANWQAIEEDHKAYETGIALLRTKMGMLLASPLRRNILCQARSTFWRDTPLIIADLNRAKVGDFTAKLLGSLLMARSTCSVYLTDLAFFSSDHMAGLLSQERFTGSFQYLQELTPKLRERVLTIRDKTVCRTTPKDAEVLAPYVGIIKPSNLVDLAADEMRTATETKDIPPLLYGKRLGIIRKHSREEHTRSRAFVEDQINLALRAH